MSLKDVLANRMAQNETDKTVSKVNPLLARKLKIAQQKNESQSELPETPTKISQELADEVVNKIIAPQENNVVEEEPQKNSEVEQQIQGFELQTETAIVPSNVFSEEESETLEEPAEENNDEPKEISEDESQKEVKKSRPQKKKNSSSKIKSEDFSKIQSADFNKINILGQKFNYDEAAALVMNSFIDDKWKEYEKEIIEKLDNIRIEPDMNPGTLKYALADLNNLYDEISVPLIEQKKLLDSLTDKDFGVASAYKIANKNNGSNEDEREANAIAALTSVGENKLNFIALIAAAKMRYIFLNSIYQRIQYKSNICITMSGAIKMEMNLIGGNNQ